MSERLQPRLLVVEDERNVGSTLVERLQKEGFEVIWVTNVADARTEITGRKFDLALIDVGLPDGSGFDVAAFLRKTQRSTATIFLTAFGNPEDRVRGFELGAEDYVVKPFHFKELVLRIQNGLKRVKYLDQANEDVRVGRAMVYFSRYEAAVGTEAHALTQKEAALLKLLVDKRGTVVSRAEILDRVWSEDEYPTSRTVDNFIMRIRRLVELDPENPEVIRSVRGVGYQLVAQ